MSLPHAILGFLSALPMTGYDLKTQAFDRTVAHFWPAVLPQIYRELGKLEESGWVASEVEIQQGKPNRRVYTITPAGQQELTRWLREFEAPLGHREPFLIQLFFGTSLTNAELLMLLQTQRAGHLERQAALDAIAIPPPQNDTDARRQALTKLTLNLGQKLEQTYIEWLDEAIEVVENLRIDA